MVSGWHCFPSPSTSSFLHAEHLRTAAIAVSVEKHLLRKHVELASRVFSPYLDEANSL